MDSVAEQYQMTGEELLSKNIAIAEEENLEKGQVITVEKALPRLSVYTVDETSYTKTVARPVREVADDSMYVGDRKVIEEGRDGQEEIFAEVTSLNGEVQKENILRRTVLEEPVESVVAVGTMERPPFYSTGSLQWPTQGDLTSPFGYRSIFGGSSFHSGIDIANAQGTEVFAADSGVMTFTGYKGSYGNLVIIDHGNGWETYYAHSSENLVYEGDTVTKGDLIALMGSTGRSTGNHCHFEMHVDGQAVDPQGYLPWTILDQIKKATGDPLPFLLCKLQ